MKNSKFVVRGGNELNGEITIQASKNATLPIMSAALLADGSIKLKNCPNISDVANMVKILKSLNVKVKKIKNNYIINPQNASNSQIDCELAKSMRSSIFLLGSTLSKFKTTTISMPGGCKIGARPIDISVNSLKKLGVKVVPQGDCLFFDATKAKAKKIKLRLPSVSATENLIQFACKLKGKTVIKNCAREPEVVDLCNFLNLRGAKIFGAGTSKITIIGVDKLVGVEYQPIGDRIVAGTIMIAVAICGGEVVLKNGVPYQNKKLIKILSSMGCKINIKNDIITISRQNKLSSAKLISTGCYPSFPTDLQSQMLVLSLFVEGKTRIVETVFENRFLIVGELKKLGARIKTLNNREVEIEGMQFLKGGEVLAQDLRGGASLVLAGLMGKAATIGSNIACIDRGYDSLEKMLSRLGADIKRQ